MSRLLWFVFGITFGVWLHDELMQWAEKGVNTVEPGTEPPAA